MTEPARPPARDLTVLAVPFYFGAMAVEYVWLKRRVRRLGPSAGAYERRDTLASLAMGTASLVAPFVVPALLRPFRLGHGRTGRVVVGLAVGAAAATTAADQVVRRSTRARSDPSPGTDPPAGPGPVPGASVDPAGGEAAHASPPGGLGGRGGHRLPGRAGPGRHLGGAHRAATACGGVADSPTSAGDRRRWLLAIVGWDFIYYWNHRFMHESRYMWAIHVVHHSSERYNLSTALRQPVADAFGTFVPYGLLCLVGISPELVATARGVNLLYQYWIHTETIRRLGPLEAVLNTPSHHRVHHGRNRQYLDRNHGSILILWDRLFGTFEPEGEPVVYGLTKNINTFNPGRIASHEFGSMLRDVSESTGWIERLSHVIRGPGWGAGRTAAPSAETGSEAA